MTRADVLADKKRHREKKAVYRQRRRQRMQEEMQEAKGEARACRTNMERMYEHWISFPEYTKQIEKLWSKIHEWDEQFYDPKTNITWFGSKRDMVLQAAAERIACRLDPESELYQEFTTLPEEEDDDDE